MANDTWILVADASRARLFTANRTLSSIDEDTTTWLHGSSRLRTSELVTDARESQRTGRGPRSGPAGGLSAHAKEERTFAGMVAEDLRQARTTAQFKHLVLVAAPHFLGELRTAMDDATRATVTAEIAKDYTGHDAEKIGPLVKQQLDQTPNKG